MISVSSSSAAEKRKLGKPREGDEDELDGDAVRRRSFERAAQKEVEITQLLKITALFQFPKLIFDNENGFLTCSNFTEKSVNFHEKLGIKKSALEV